MLKAEQYNNYNGKGFKHISKVSGVMHLSMFSPRGGGPGIPGGFDIVCLPEGGGK